jgi:hypothetical protein
MEHVFDVVVYHKMMYCLFLKHSLSILLPDFVVSDYGIHCRPGWPDY